MQKYERQAMPTFKRQPMPTFKKTSKQEQIHKTKTIVTSLNRALFIKRLLVYLVYRLVHHPCKRIHWTRTHMSKKSKDEDSSFKYHKKGKMTLIIKNMS